MTRPNTPPALALALASLVLAAATGCTQPPDLAVDAEDAGADVFQFGMTSDRSVAIAARSGEEPVAGVVLMLRLLAEPPHQPPAVVWRGMTDVDGRGHGLISLPAAVETLTLTAYKRGYRGPYDDEALRQQHGQTAPAAWVEIRVADLHVSTLTFERSEP